MKRILSLLLMLIAVNIVLAQDSTAEVTEQVVTVMPTAVATEVPPDTVIVNTGDTETPVDPAEPWWAKYAVQLVIFGGLIVGALKGLNAFLANRLANQQFMQSAEYAYRAITPDSVETGIDSVLVGLARELELFGGNASKFLSQLGTKGDVIAQKVEDAKKS